MKRTIIAASVLALGLAGGGIATAEPAEQAAYGICVAYEHNSDKAKEKSPVFADDPEPDVDGCDHLKPGKGGGNGGGNGRGGN